MRTQKLKEGVYSVGVMNPSLRVFDIIMKADYGTTYNAYLIKGDKVALIETSHEDYLNEYLDNINEVSSLNKIDYIILNHTEPDHSGSLKKILEIQPEITVVASIAAQKYLANMMNMPYKSLTVKMGDTLDLGQGHILSFIPAPFLHWPDTMFTYDAGTKTVFTCDFLGAHYCEPQGLDVHVKDQSKYDYAFEYYYQAIMSPFKEYVVEGLKKLNALDFDMVCPSHGVVLTQNCQMYIDRYVEWSAPHNKSGNGTILIVYASAYGYTKHLAVAANEALNSAGYKTFMYDILEAPVSKILESLEQSDAFIVATNTINRDSTKPMWDLLTSIDAINTKRPAGVMGSYGWSGEAIEMVFTRLKQLKFAMIGEGLKVIFRPSEVDLKAAADYALAIALNIKK